MIKILTLRNWSRIERSLRIETRERSRSDCSNAGTRFDGLKKGLHLIGFSDVLPTLADFTGVDLPEGSIDGVSYAPQLRGKPGNPHNALFSWYVKGPFRSSIDKAKRFAWNHRWKLYANGKLYHITEDPGEQHPIKPGEGNAGAKQARKKLWKKLQSMPSVWQARDRMRALTD